MKIEFEIVSKDQITDSIREIFAEALKRQGKVQGNLQEKADRCKWLCIARINAEVAGVGAIKVKTSSDFSQEKADLPNLSDDFKWELGYFFTEPAHAGEGIGKAVARILVDAFGAGNLMASTELSANPAMVRILESLGFRQYGKPWKSAIHGKYLGLFLRFV
jgi:GNAT superfamily N-acetyltransferase